MCSTLHNTIIYKVKVRKKNAHWKLYIYRQICCDNTKKFGRRQDR